MKVLDTKDGLTMGYVTTIEEDANKFVWIGTYFGLNRYDGNQITQFIPDHFDPWGLHANIIFTIKNGPDNLLWLGTNQGLICMDPATERFFSPAMLSKQFPENRIIQIFITSTGDILALQGDEKSQWILKIKANHQVKSYIQSGDSSKLIFEVKKLYLPSIFEGFSNLFYPYKEDKILLRDKKSRYFSFSIHSGQFDTIPIKQIVPENTSQPVLRHVGKKYGVILKKEDGENLPAERRSELLFVPGRIPLICEFLSTQLKEYNPAPSNDTEKTSALYSIDQPSSGAKLLDSKGNIWLGTIGYGVRILQRNLTQIQIEEPTINFSNLSLLPNDIIWPGYIHHDKVYHYPLKKMQTSPWNKYLSRTEKVITVHYSKKYNACFLVVVDTEKKRQKLVQFDWSSQTFLERNIPLQNYNSSPPLIREDSYGNLWIVNGKGELLRLNPVSNKLTNIPLSPYFPEYLLNDFIPWDMIQSDSDEMWIGNSLGLLKIRQLRETPVVSAYYNQTNKRLFKNNGTFCLSQDDTNPNLLWLGTLGYGLASFDKEKEVVTYYPDQEKLKFSIIADMQSTGNLLWLSSDNAVSCFDKSIRKYISINNQLDNKKLSLNIMSSAQMEDGNIVFGTGTGLLKFQPKTILPENKNSITHLTSLQVKDMGIRQLIANQMLTIHADSTYSLKLPSNTNTIQFEFGCPSSEFPREIAFEYRLHSSEQQWQNMYKRYMLSLSDLNAGKYTLEVRQLQRQFQQSKPLIIYIDILPPWYLTTTAKGFYVLLLFTPIGLLLYNDRKRLQLSYDSKLHQAEVIKLKALASQKNRFIAYLVHEFKTPLTLINAYTQQNITNNTSLPNNDIRLELVDRESKNMLQIIDELIDMSRLHEGGMTPRLVNGDVQHLIREVCNSLSGFLEMKKISIIQEFSVQKLLSQFDPDRLKYILNNLLLNAIRFSHNNSIIKIATRFDQQQYYIIITDFGEGISAKEIQYIFDYYFQGGQSESQRYHYGLGLSFVKELIQMFGGTIGVSSTPDVQTEFVISLPLIPINEGESSFTPTKTSSHYNPSAPEWSISYQNDTFEKPLCLIVEDDPRMMSLLNSQLSPHFRIKSASDGQQGLEIALAEVPDIILTDIIMPKLDGLKFTHSIKTNTLTSHIPVVMLSSLSATEDKIKGQMEGAEAYLPKPFNSKELILQLINLVKLQTSWKLRYSDKKSDEQQSNDLNDVYSIGSIEKTDEFMQSLLLIFESHYQSESLDSDEIARLLHVSRRQLYRKISAVSEIGTMEILRNFRLEKAANFLISQPTMTIKEVAFNTGFKERTHFSKNFILKYGIKPSEFKNNHNNPTT